MKKRIGELSNQLEAIDEKYILDKIDHTLYKKYRQKYQTDIDQLKQELNNNNVESLDLEKAVNRELQFA